MARREARGQLDPEGRYSAEDLVVTARADLHSDEAVDRLTDQLPAREVVYRLTRLQPQITLAELAREFVGTVPGGARPPYSQDPAIYVLRLLAGHRSELPPLASMDALVRLLASEPGPEPDYGFEVRPR